MGGRQIVARLASELAALGTVARGVLRSHLLQVQGRDRAWACIPPAIPPRSRRCRSRLRTYWRCDAYILASSASARTVSSTNWRASSWRPMIEQGAGVDEILDRPLASATSSSRSGSVTSSTRTARREPARNGSADAMHCAAAPAQNDRWATPLSGRAELAHPGVEAALVRARQNGGRPGERHPDQEWLSTGEPVMQHSSLTALHSWHIAAARTFARHRTRTRASEAPARPAAACSSPRPGRAPPRGRPRSRGSVPPESQSRRECRSARSRCCRAKRRCVGVLVDRLVMSSSSRKRRRRVRPPPAVCRYPGTPCPRGPRPRIAGWTCADAAIERNAWARRHWAARAAATAATFAQCATFSFLKVVVVGVRLGAAGRIAHTSE